MQRNGDKSSLDLQLSGILLLYRPSLHLRFIQSTVVPAPLVDCHHFVLLHLNTSFNELITAFGLWSQTHHMALRMLSATSSDKNGHFIFVHIFLATLAALVQ